jgi:hypothetical protein
MLTAPCRGHPLARRGVAWQLRAPVSRLQRVPVARARGGERALPLAVAHSVRRPPRPVALWPMPSPALRVYPAPVCAASRRCRCCSARPRSPRSCAIAPAARMCAAAARRRRCVVVQRVAVTYGARRAAHIRQSGLDRSERSGFSAATPVAGDRAGARVRVRRELLLRAAEPVGSPPGPADPSLALPCRALPAWPGPSAALPPFRPSGSHRTSTHARAARTAMHPHPTPAVRAHRSRG